MAGSIQSGATINNKCVHAALAGANQQNERYKKWDWRHQRVDGSAQSYPLCFCTYEYNARENDRFISLLLVEIWSYIIALPTIVRSSKSYFHSRTCTKLLFRSGWLLQTTSRITQFIQFTPSSLVLGNVYSLWLKCDISDIWPNPVSVLERYLGLRLDFWCLKGSKVYICIFSWTRPKIRLLNW